LHVASITEHHASLQKSEVFNTIELSLQTNETGSCGIWTILPQWATEFCKLAPGIGHNFWRKNRGPYNFNTCILLMSQVRAFIDSHRITLLPSQSHHIAILYLFPQLLLNSSTVTETYGLI